MKRKENEFRKPSAEKYPVVQEADIKKKKQ